MTDTYRVKIDLTLLAANTSKGEGRLVNEAEVRDFLVDQGFIPCEKGWICEEISLRLLNPEEIVSCTSHEPY